MEKIQQYRQPMVTATGIFLGFMLEFINGWIPNSFTAHKFRDAVIGVGSVLSIALLIVVLYRILRMNYPPQSTDHYNRKTLSFFTVGISIPFFSIVVILFQKLLLSISS